MVRVRIAIALLLLSIAGAASVLPSSDAATEGRGYSHRLTVVSGELVDRWTVTDSEPCHVTGGGTMTLKFQFVKTKLVKLIYHPWAAGNIPGKPGSWVVGIPGPGRRGHPRHRVAAGQGHDHARRQHDAEPSGARQRRLRADR